MGKYVIKRLILAVLTVLVICAITFFAMHAIPGGPFNREKALSPKTIASLQERYGLDKPLPEQFFNYMKGIVKGDFGVSLKNGREISAIIGESFPVSAKLGVSAMVIALILGTVFGCTAALMRNKLPDRIIVFFSRKPRTSSSGAASGSAEVVGVLPIPSSSVFIPGIGRVAYSGI